MKQLAKVACTLLHQFLTTMLAAVLLTVGWGTWARDTDTGVKPPVSSLEIAGSRFALHPIQAYRPTLRLDATQWLGVLNNGQWGLSVGISSSSQDHTTLLSSAPPPTWGPSVGMHWRSALGGGIYVGVSTWTPIPWGWGAPTATDMIWQGQKPTYATRLEVQWQSPRFGGLIPEWGAIGLQLEGDSRLLLRARHGGPMLYYRTSF